MKTVSNDKRIAIVGLIHAYLLSWPITCSAQQAPLDVCGVLSKLRELNSEKAFIRGEFAATDEGNALVPENGRECRPHFESDGKIFLDGIFLKADSVNGVKRPEHLRKALDSFRNSRDPDGFPELVLVEALSGRLELPPRFTYRFSNGLTVMQGFGAGQALPAMLVFSEIVDAQISGLRSRGRPWLPPKSER